MREHKINDIWRHINNIGDFETRIELISFNNIKGFSEITIEPQGAITSICGKNGVGKTTLLKFIYNILQNEKNFLQEERFSNCKFEIKGMNKGSQLHLVNDKHYDGVDNVYYIDPAKECAKILSYLNNVDNFKELLEGIEESNILNNPKMKSLIERAIGRKYNYIYFSEIASALDNDYIFPFFQVQTPNGIIYNNQSMGMGELSSLYIIWFMAYCDKNSIVFIEEPENYISAYTQQYLMDIIAYYVDHKKIWVFLSTHSEHILSKLELKNTKVLNKNNDDITYLISPNDSSKYLNELGLTPPTKGIILVEDSLAEKFLLFIFMKFCPSFLKEHKIVQLRCDSNIEKLVLHYEPQTKTPFNIIGVFDADQKNKISRLIGKNIYVSALPSVKPEPPEKTIWAVVEGNISEIAAKLNLPQYELESAIENIKCTDYHDRFISLSKIINKSEEAILECFFSIWINDPVNENLAKNFCYSVLTYENGFTLKRISDQDKEDSILVKIENHTFNINKQNIKSINLYQDNKKVKIYFDGSECFLSL